MRYGFGFGYNKHISRRLCANKTPVWLLAFRVICAYYNGGTGALVWKEAHRPYKWIDLLTFNYSQRRLDGNL